MLLYRWTIKVPGHMIQLLDGYLNEKAEILNLEKWPDDSVIEKVEPNFLYIQNPTDHEVMFGVQITNS